MKSLFIFEFIVFSIISLILIFILLLLAFLLGPKNVSNEKVSAYECGFEPFGDARDNFDIHFYVVALLFIIFDVEIIFLVPWVISLSSLSSASFWSMLLFLILFIVGFIYEYRMGLID
jgi:NADH:ubiquinone oxidoreductase subunit 3 (subunit A)